MVYDVLVDRVSSHRWSSGDAHFLKNPFITGFIMQLGRTPFARKLVTRRFDGAIAHRRDSAGSRTAGPAAFEEGSSDDPREVQSSRTFGSEKSLN